MHIIADVRPCAHAHPTRRLVASYAGTVSGLRALLAAAARRTAGGAR